MKTKDTDAQAAHFASQADYWFSAGNHGKAYKLYARAAQITEECVATASGPKSKALFMSNAVLLWYKSRDYARAQNLAYKYLSNDPPASIINKLRDAVLRSWQEEALPPHVHFAELEVSLHGREIGVGYAPVEEVTRREEAAQSLLWRAAEFESGEQLRARGNPNERIMKFAQLYTSVGGIGSYKLRFKVVADATQEALPQTGVKALLAGETLVHRAVELAKIVSTGSEQELAEAVPDPIYRVAFMKTIRDMAPDGKRVDMVNVGGGKTRWKSAALTDETKNRLRQDIGRVYEREGLRELKGRLVGLDLQRAWLVAKVEAPTKQNCYIKIDSDLTDRLAGWFRRQVSVVGRDEGQRFVVAHMEVAGERENAA
jgi:hypothetical protein